MRYDKTLHKIQHTQKMRKAYKASAKASRRIAREWRHVDAEMARRLDEMEKE